MMGKIKFVGDRNKQYKNKNKLYNFFFFLCHFEEGYKDTHWIYKRYITFDLYSKINKKKQCTKMFSDICIL